MKKKEKKSTVNSLKKDYSFPFYRQLTPYEIGASENNAKKINANLPKCLKFRIKLTN